jgi:hypothetical protein
VSTQQEGVLKKMKKSERASGQVTKFQSQSRGSEPSVAKGALDAKREEIAGAKTNIESVQGDINHIREKE